MSLPLRHKILVLKQIRQAIVRGVQMPWVPPSAFLGSQDSPFVVDALVARGFLDKSVRKGKTLVRFRPEKYLQLMEMFSLFGAPPPLPPRRYRLVVPQ